MLEAQYKNANTMPSAIIRCEGLDREVTLMSSICMLVPQFTIAQQYERINHGLPQAARLRYRRTHDDARRRIADHSPGAPGRSIGARHPDYCDSALLPSETAARHARRANAGGHRTADALLPRGTVGSAGNGRMAAHDHAALHRNYIDHSLSTGNSPCSFAIRAQPFLGEIRFSQSEDLAR